MPFPWTSSGTVLLVIWPVSICSLCLSLLLSYSLSLSLSIYIYIYIYIAIHFISTFILSCSIYLSHVVYFIHNPYDISVSSTHLFQSILISSPPTLFFSISESSFIPTISFIFYKRFDFWYDPLQCPLRFFPLFFIQTDADMWPPAANQNARYHNACSIKQTSTEGFPLMLR